MNQPQNQVLSPEFSTTRWSVQLGSLQNFISIALESGKSGDSIKTGVHRLRQRFQQCLRAQLIKTVAVPAQAVEELSQLRQISQR